MVEAVGQAYWPAYLDAIARPLRPGGRAAIQYILIDDALFDAYAASSDFIQAYIFPGGCLLSASSFRALAADRGFAWRDVSYLGCISSERPGHGRETVETEVVAGRLAAGRDAP